MIALWLLIRFSLWCYFRRCHSRMFDDSLLEQHSGIIRMFHIPSLKFVIAWNSENFIDSTWILKGFSLQRLLRLGMWWKVLSMRINCNLVSFNSNNGKFHGLKTFQDPFLSLMPAKKNSHQRVAKINWNSLRACFACCEWFLFTFRHSSASCRCFLFSFSQHFLQLVLQKLLANLTAIDGEPETESEFA